MQLYGKFYAIIIDFLIQLHLFARSSLTHIFGWGGLASNIPYMILYWIVCKIFVLDHAELSRRR